MTKTIPPSPQSPPAPRPEKREPDHDQVHHLSHDERFWQLYLAAFANLHSQFEQQDPDNGYTRFAGGAEELERSKDLAQRAWNSAIAGCAQFEQDEAAMDEFNREIEATAAEDEEEDEP